MNKEMYNIFPENWRSVYLQKSNSLWIEILLNSITICYITCCAERKSRLSGKKIHVTSALCVLKLKIFNSVRMYEALGIYHLLLLK